MALYNLPLEVRFAEENMFLRALTPGSEDPKHINNISKELIDEILPLCTNGLKLDRKKSSNCLGSCSLRGKGEAGGVEYLVFVICSCSDMKALVFQGSQCLQKNASFSASSAENLWTSDETPIWNRD